MASTTWSSAPDHATDALFRSWGSGLSTALSTVGLVQTADTGQINWSTVVRAGVNSDAGYEIWRFNDTMQATVPIFVKFYYGTYTPASSLRLLVEVGSGSNGSGSLTGLQTPSASLWGASPSVPFAVGLGDTTSRSNWAASDQSGLVLALWNNSSQTPSRFVLVIDRFREPTGVSSPYGWITEFVTGAGSTGTNIVNVADQVVDPLGYLPCLIPFNLTSTSTFFNSSSGHIIAFPHYFACKRGVFSTKMIVSYAPTDLVYNDQQNMIHLGSVHTFRAMGLNVSRTTADRNVNTSALIWQG